MEDLILLDASELADNFRLLDANRIVGGSSAGRLGVFDSQSGEPLWSAAGDRGAIDRLAVSPDGCWAISGGLQRGSVYVWRLPNVSLE